MTAVIVFLGRKRHRAIVRDRRRVAVSVVQQGAVRRHVRDYVPEQLQRASFGRLIQVSPELVLEGGAIKPLQRRERAVGLVGAGAAHYFSGSTTSSTRRLLARPSGVALSAIGRWDPSPEARILSLGMPRDTR